MDPLPEREPGEKADHYLVRLNNYQALLIQSNKEIARQERRIRSEVEKALIQRAIKEALPKKPRPQYRAFIKNQRGPRTYKIPDNLWMSLIFAPLHLLISIVWQDKNRKEAPEYTEIPLSRIMK